MQKKTYGLLCRILKVDCINIKKSLLSNDTLVANSLKIKHYYLTDGKAGKDPSGIITKIFRDNNNKFWIGTEGRGLFCFELSDSRNQIDENLVFLNVKNFVHNTDDMNSLSNNSIRDILQDNKNNIWILH